MRLILKWPSFCGNYFSIAIARRYAITSIKNYASRLQLDELADACVERMTVKDTSPSMFSKGDLATRGGNVANSLNKTADETLQNLLRHVWGSQDDEDSSCELHTDIENNVQAGQDSSGLNERSVTDDEYSAAFAALSQRVTARDRDSESEHDSCTEQQSSGESTIAVTRARRSSVANMTLHERMTRALLDGTPSDCDTESDDPRLIGHPDRFSSEKDNSNNALAKDDDVRDPTSKLTDAQEDKSKPIMQLFVPVCRPSQSTNSQPMCLSVETPQTTTVPRSLRVESSTPDLFGDSPEMLCLTDKSSEFNAYQKVSTESVSADCDVFQNQSEIDSVVSGDKTHADVSNGSPRKPHTCSSSDRSVAQQPIGSRSDTGRSSTDYESPVIQSQPSQGHVRAATPFVSQRRRCKRTRRRSINAVKRLSEKFAMTSDADAMSPDLQSRPLVEHVFGNESLYRSTSKYSPRYSRYRNLDDTAVDSPQTEARSRAAADRGLSSQSKRSRTMRSGSSSPEIPVVKRSRLRATPERSPLKPSTPPKTNDGDQRESSPDDELPSLESVVRSEESLASSARLADSQTNMNNTRTVSGSSASPKIRDAPGASSQDECAAAIDLTVDSSSGSGSQSKSHDRSTPLPKLDENTSKYTFFLYSIAVPLETRLYFLLSLRVPL